MCNRKFALGEKRRALVSFSCYSTLWAKLGDASGFGAGQITICLN